MSSKKQNKSTGDLGEAIAAQFLMKRGYTVLERNYRVPMAEIDIIAQLGDTVHFVEVKTVSFESKDQLKKSSWRPEEQVHERKLHQLKKGVEIWQHQHRYTGNVQIDVIAAKIVPRETFASVNMIENVVVG